jgi:hypothetical protein
MWRYLGLHFTTGSQQNNLLEILHARVTTDPKLVQQLHVEGVALSNKLIEVVAAGTTSEEYKMQKGFAWVRGLGQGLVTCSQMVLTTAHLGKKNKHWVALAVDTEAKKIYYGDSLGSLIPTNLFATYQWCMQQHYSSSSELHNLPITQQEDESSCSIVADNALTHLTFPNKVPLYTPLEMQATRMLTFI